MTFSFFADCAASRMLIKYSILSKFFYKKFPLEKWEGKPCKFCLNPKLNSAILLKCKK